MNKILKIVYICLAILGVLSMATFFVLLNAKVIEIGDITVFSWISIAVLVASTIVLLLEKVVFRDKSKK